MLDVLAAIGIGSLVGVGARMLKDGVTINPGAKTPETYAAIEKANDRIFTNTKWKISDIEDGTYKDFSKGK